MGDWEPGLECQILLSFADWVAAGGERSGEGSGERSGHSGKEGGRAGGGAGGGSGGGSGGGGGATGVAGGSAGRGGGAGGDGGDGGGEDGGTSTVDTSTVDSVPPSVYLASLSERYPNREKCEEVWSGEHMAYRCRDCGLSESSCMCVACFDPDQVCY